MLATSWLGRGTGARLMRYWRRGVWVGAALATGALTTVALRTGGLGGTGPLLSVLGFFVSLAGLLHTVRQPPVTVPADERLDRAADALAAAVRAQWRSEWRLRRLQDPEPLAVRWSRAPAWLSDLDTAVGWPSRDTQRPDLTGRLPDISQVFGYVPSRRLVVIGAPGSGKTVLAVRFTLDLLDRRSADDGVPVLFQASSWQSDRQSLHAWLAGRLVAAHPALGADGPAGTTLARTLVESGRILPVVDGLDEMPEPLRAAAVWRLNTELDAGAPLLLTCRSTVFAEVVEAGDVLTSAAVVELQPLRFEEAAEYLVRTARPLRGPHGERTTAWDPVFDRIRRDPGTATARCLRQVLSLPLMVAMARAVYGDTGHDPAELLDRPGLATPEALEQHLLDAFVPASLRTSTRWPAEDAARWLAFLARQSERRGSRDLAWWELRSALPRPLRAVGPLLLLGAVAELICLAFWAKGADVGVPVTAATVVLGLCAGHLALGRTGAPARRLLLALACVVPLGAVVGALRPLTRDLHFHAPFTGMPELLGWLVVGPLYGLSVAAALAATGLTPAAAPATMPFPLLRNRYGRWVWKTVGALTTGVMTALVVASLFFTAPGSAALVSGAVGAVAGFCLVRGEGTASAEQAVRLGRRSGGQGRRFGRALWQGLRVGLLTGIVLGIGFAVAEGTVSAARAVAQPEFPVRGPVHHDADGRRYVLAGDGTRFGRQADGLRFFVPARPLRGGLVDDRETYGESPVFISDYETVWDEPCTAASRCRPYSAVMEVSVRREDEESGDSVMVRLPDGRSMPGYYTDEVLDRRAVRWITREDAPQLFTSALSFGLGSALGLGVVAGFAAGLHRWLGAPVDVTRTPSPLASLHTDRDTAVVRAFLVSFVGLFTGISLSASLPAGVSYAAIVFLPVGFITLALSAWGGLLTARLWLCPAGRLPWRLMAFLADAHERGVLRQAGAVYQFRHARLQERLAAAPPDRESGPRSG
ncbi:NACHT domain-containing protein [Streptomyces longispororuber]|uniref:NACHT domain-containing protein n=1 Tax=Streptomyces longispororuber TaxID=68230 RepID=UPI0021089EDD|nr:NACHT domain-containing protein [Streptomyces longispororuber]MCQ4208636.1 NACHT domain-containing protein [Streptomyces longispororuber]